MSSLRASRSGSTRRILAAAVSLAVPVVVVTAEEEEGRRAALQAGAEDYLTKPFSPRALVLTVEQVLEGSEPTGE